MPVEILGTQKNGLFHDETYNKHLMSSVSAPSFENKKEQQRKQVQRTKKQPKMKHTENEHR